MAKLALLAALLAPMAIAESPPATPLPAESPPASTLPLQALPAETLEGSPFAVPGDLPPRPALLVIGFTRASKAQTWAWSRRLRAELSSPDVPLYQVAMLEDVPALMRGFVSRGIRSDVPEPLRSTFLVVTAQTAAWQQLAGYAGGDAAHVVLLDDRRRVAWRASGEVSDALVESLRQQLQVLLPVP